MPDSPPPPECANCGAPLVLLLTALYSAITIA